MSASKVIIGGISSVFLGMAVLYISIKITSVVVNRFSSSQQTNLPMMLIVLRKGSAAAHYVLGGPTANRNNAFTLGIAASEIYVMHGETAAIATYARRLGKEKEAGNDLQPVIDKMNDLSKKYHDKSRPLYCAKHGLIDELVALKSLRKYLVAFSAGAYQNPKSICPQRHMRLSRIIKG